MKHEPTDTHLLSFKIKAGRENNKAPTAETLGKIQWKNSTNICAETV